MKGKEISLREIFLNIAKEGMVLMNIEEGIVTKEEPVVITLVNDKKIKLSAVDLVIPERMKDHEITITEGGEKRKITVKNALKANDKVYLLSYSGGKLFYVLDRV